MPDGYRRYNTQKYNELLAFRNQNQDLWFTIRKLGCQLFGHSYDQIMVFEVGSRKKVGQLYHGAMCPMCLEIGNWVIEETVGAHSDIPAV